MSGLRILVWVGSAIQLMMDPTLPFLYSYSCIFCANLERYCFNSRCICTMLCSFETWTRFEFSLLIAFRWGDCVHVGEPDPVGEELAFNDCDGIPLLPSPCLPAHQQIQEPWCRQQGGQPSGPLQSRGIRRHPWCCTGWLIRFNLHVHVYSVFLHVYNGSDQISYMYYQ